MVPQLVRIGAEFGISCFSCGGFDGLAGKHEAAVRAVNGGPKPSYSTSAATTRAVSTCSEHSPRT